MSNVMGISRAESKPHRSHIATSRTYRLPHMDLMLINRRLREEEQKATARK